MPSENDVRTCGCLEGGIGTLIGLAIFGSIVLLDWTALPAKGWGLVAVALVFAIAGALLGKLVGMLRVQRRAPEGAGPDRE